ncbi:exo70, partial [Drosophila busckii]
MNNLDSSLQAHNKLEKETTNLVLLKDRVDKYHDLSTQMSSILTIFEKRLGNLEQTILPVYQETEQLQKRQQNLEATLNCLESVLSHYDVSQEVCQLIHQGPVEGNIAVFLDALAKLRAAMDYFLHNNSQSVELENVTSLFNTGCEGLNQHYSMLLKKHSAPLKPVELLDLIYIEDDSSSDEFTSFRQLSQSTREELFTISHWLEQNLREYTHIYATERGEVVLRSLQLLKDHQKSSSWGTEALSPFGCKRTPTKNLCISPINVRCSTPISDLRSPNMSPIKNDRKMNNITSLTFKKPNNFRDKKKQEKKQTPIVKINDCDAQLELSDISMDMTDANDSLDSSQCRELRRRSIAQTNHSYLINHASTVEEVLLRLGLERYRDVFKRAQVDFVDIVCMDSEDLLRLGFFEKKANKLYLRATQTIEQSTGFSIKKASSHSDHLTSEDLLDGDQELDKYLVMLLGLQRLLNWERAIMRDIIPPSKHNEVFARLAYNAIELVVKDAESITQRILRCISRKEWTSALGIFSALKRVILLQPDMERTYDTAQREQLTKVLNKLQQTGAKALEHFLDVVKGESSTNIVGQSNVPKDATVHELTSNTIWFIEHLYEHFDVIGAILAQDVLYSTQLDTILMKKALPGEERNKALLAIYIKKALAELNLSIMNKCEQYNDQATKHLFRLNNIHYILKSLQRSTLIDLVTLAEPECEHSYLEMIRELKTSYQKTWSKMLAGIYSLDELPKPVAGKVKDKDRSVLKERFSNFNKDFEEACKIIKRNNVEHIQ